MFSRGQVFLEKMQRHHLFCLAFIIFVAGCTPPAKPVRDRYFWPPIAGAEKIEYRNFYLSEAEVEGESENVISDIVFGKEIRQAMFGRPHSIASDGRGRVFVGDVGVGKVFVLDMVQKEVRFLKDPTGQSDQSFVFPGGIEVGNGGQVYVVDSMRRKVHLFSRDETMLNTFSIKGKGRLGGLAYSKLLQRLYLVDIENHQILILSDRGELVGSFGRRGSQAGEFNFPLDVDVDASGDVYVLDSMNARVQVFDSSGNYQRQFGERGTASGSFQLAKSLAVSPSGQVYVTDSIAHKVVIFDLKGIYLLTFGGRYYSPEGKISPGGIYMPEGIAVDSSDQIWICDSLNRVIHEFQYLTEDYLRKNPILPGQAARPKNLQQEKMQ